MRRAHLVADIRAAEAALMQTVADGTLMQRAAVGLATVCTDFLGGTYGARILVLAGSGNNGGDALYAGARLARRGALVEAMLLSESVHDGGLADLLRAGGRVVSSYTASQYDLVLDGIVGIGGTPGLRAEAAALVAQVDAPIVAVDIPSGVGVDSAEVAGDHVQADVTVTFGTHKVGLLVDPAGSSVGVVELVDIGLDPYLPDPAVEALQADDVRRLLPRPGHTDHKYSRGVLGIAAGSPGYTGAGLLVTGAALATGFAGMIRYDGASDELIRSHHPEVVIGSGRVQAWVVGPGFGEGLGKRVEEVLAEGLPTVVDADGLRQLPDRLTSPAVLTPHAGELARMLDCERAAVESDMLGSATRASQRWDAVVVLKGPRTVIASPQGRVRVNATGVPWLATAGAGDVLAGVIGALLAAGLDRFDAASVGVWLHGSAATLASLGAGSPGAGVVGPWTPRGSSREPFGGAGGTWSHRDSAGGSGPISGGGPISATSVIGALAETIRLTLA